MGFRPRPIKKIEKQKNYKCQSCDASYAQVNSLHQHIETVHLEKRFKCNICDKDFSQKRTLENHISTNHFKEEKSKVASDVCEKSFIGNQSLKKHKKAFHENGESCREFICIICFEMFPSRALLLQHNAEKHE